jgi:hypothetical protein
MQRAHARLDPVDGRRRLQHAAAGRAGRDHAAAPLDRRRDDVVQARSNRCAAVLRIRRRDRGRRRALRAVRDSGVHIVDAATLE